MGGLVENEGPKRRVGMRERVMEGRARMQWIGAEGMQEGRELGRGRKSRAENKKAGGMSCESGKGGGSNTKMTQGHWKSVVGMGATIMGGNFRSARRDVSTSGKV